MSTVWSKVGAAAVLVAALGLAGCSGEAADADGGAGASSASPVAPSVDASASPESSESASTPGSTATASPTDSASEPESVETLPAVDLDEDADFGNGITARVAKVRAVNAEASGAGEISGPAVAVTIELENGTAKKLDLGTVNVQMVYGDDDTPALPVFGDSRADSFSGSLKPDATKKGVYIFTVPKDARGDATITVSYEGSSPIVAFQGSLPS